MMDTSENRLKSEETKRKYESGTSSTDESSSSSITNEKKKTCADCGTSKTPLWRSGPAGPKSLCNACGIKSRKKRQAALSIGTEEKKKRRSSSITNHHNNNNKNIQETLNKNNNNWMKNRFMGLGEEVMMKRSTVEKRWKKLGEVEQAAVLLMAISYASVYA